MEVIRGVQMKRVRQFLEKRALEEVHHNPHIAALKALAKNSKSRMVRFVIDKNNDLYAGDANHTTHADMYDNDSGNDIHGIVGLSITSTRPKYYFDSWNASTGPGSGTPRPNHSILDIFEKYGISRNT